jgi:hypothetical protein
MLRIDKGTTHSRGGNRRQPDAAHPLVAGKTRLAQVARNAALRVNDVPCPDAAGRSLPNRPESFPDYLQPPSRGRVIPPFFIPCKPNSAWLPQNAKEAPLVEGAFPAKGLPGHLARCQAALSYGCLEVV